MYRKVGLIMLFLCTCLCSSWAGYWERFLIGPGGSAMTTLASGMGRNDGVQRIYAACFDSHIYEYTDSSGQWYRRDVGFSGDVMHYVNLGRGRNDLIQRVYGGSADYNVWEYTYNNPGDFWTRVCLGGGNLYMCAVCVANGRNDDSSRVYGGCFDGFVYEFTRQDSSWIKTSFPGAPRIDDIAVGPGRGDSVNRVYSGGYYGQLTESAYDSSGWHTTTIWNGSGLQAVAIGRGQYVDTLSDRRNHVYIGAMDGGVYELIYQGSSWTTNTLGYGNGGMYSVAVGPGRGDNVNRVYAGCDDGKVYEFSYVRGIGWTQDTVGSANGHIDGVAIGLGEVIGGIYATSYDGMVYGFRYHPSGVESKGLVKPSQPHFSLSSLPNPFRDRSTITFSLEKDEKVDFDIYTIDGRRIRNLGSLDFPPGTHRVIWDGCDDRGSSVGPGLYFLNLRASEGSLTARLLKLK